MDANIYLREFVDEMIDIQKNGILIIQTVKLQFKPLFATLLLELLSHVQKVMQVISDVANVFKKVNRKIM